MSPSPPQSPSLSAEVEKFAWIIDENLLRDEGVIYGISDSEPQEKIETIRFYFEERISEKRVALELAEEEIDRARQALEEGREALLKLRQQLKTLTTEYQVKEHAFYRTAAGLAIYGAIVGFNFWLVYDHLAPHWQHPWLVTAGVYFFGSLSLFNKDSFVYSGELKPTPGSYPWRLWAEEFVIPLAATLFILCWSDSGLGWLRLSATFLVIYLLFVFAGKALLGQLLKVPAEFRILQQNRVASRFRGYEQVLAKKEIADAEARLLALTDKVAAAETTRGEHLKALELLKREQETRIAYFMSEFSLARATRNSLSSRQLATIISYKRT